MKKFQWEAYVVATLVTALVMGLLVFLFCPAMNVHNPGLWLLVAVALAVFIFVARRVMGHIDFGWATVTKNVGSKGRTKSQRTFKFAIQYYLAPLILVLLVALVAFFGSPMFHATRYAEILPVKESDFATDLAESVGTDSIALMDTASARMLGDREIGSLSDVVSQYNVSYEYTQIDYNGKPIKVAALDYADFFKWMNNTHVNGYVTVDPVSMSASFHRCEGMKFVPSAYLLEDAARHLWLEYPTLMLDNLHFEIDEEGKPYYVASVIEKTIGLFGGRTVSGCVVLDPVTGDTVRYDVEQIPRWIDVVFHGNLICEQYNWQGLYQNGYWNSLFAKKGCKQVTTYTVSETAEEEEVEDDVPVSDYGYVAKDGDIWIYTGITSVNGDSSNIGFLLANERTGESRYYVIAGADEKSAMAAAEGEVQEKGYQASFPSLINIDGEPTYIMVLKDSGGLVKLYATVNVQQYNLVTTAATQAECIAKYKTLLGLDGVAQPEEGTAVTVTVAAIREAVIDGNTYIYLINKDATMYKGKVAQQESLLLLQVGDTVELTCSGKTILSCRKVEK